MSAGSQTTTATGTTATQVSAAADGASFIKVPFPPIYGEVLTAMVLLADLLVFVL